MLSGGEQQMLAIGRALLLQPQLLVMDEPTEGLAPAVVEQVVQALRELAGDHEIAVLLIEQNLGVAIDVADRVGVMVNGRIAQELPSQQLADDRELQERLLGVRASAEDDATEVAAAPVPTEPAPTTHRPCSIVPGKRVTSSASSTVASMYVLDGSSMVTPRRSQPSLVRRRSSCSATASWRRSLTPWVSAGSSTTTDTTG